MNVLVTGGAGFIGSRLAEGLVEQGHTVRILDNLSTGRKEAVPEGTELVVGDLRDDSDVAAATRDIEVVFHQAAIRSVPKSVDEPMASNQSNVEGTLSLLIGASKSGVRRLVYASSSSVYGDIGDAINREDLPTNPMSPYAVSKLAGENYCRVWSGLGRIETVSLRYFNVFGPGQHPESKYSALFPGFVSAIVKGEPAEIHWDGEQSRDFTYIDDVIEANIAAAIASDDANGETFNIASGSPKTVNEVWQAVIAHFDDVKEPKMLPKRPGDVRKTHADVSKAQRLLGWVPKADWDEAVAATVAWFR